jgi:hypothetical protein
MEGLMLSRGQKYPHLLCIKEKKLIQFCPLSLSLHNHRLYILISLIAILL